MRMKLIRIEDIQSNCWIQLSLMAPNKFDAGLFQRKKCSRQVSRYFWIPFVFGLLNPVWNKLNVFSLVSFPESNKQTKPQIENSVAAFRHHSIAANQFGLNSFLISFIASLRQNIRNELKSELKPEWCRYFIIWSAFQWWTSCLVWIVSFNMNL